MFPRTDKHYHLGYFVCCKDLKIYCVINGNIQVQQTSFVCLQLSEKFALNEVITKKTRAVTECDLVTLPAF